MSIEKGFTLNKDGRVNLVVSSSCYDTIEKDITRFEKTKDPEWNKSINILIEPILSVFFVDRIMLDSIKSFEQIKSYLKSAISESDLMNAFILTATEKARSQLDEYMLARNSGKSLNVKFNKRNVSIFEDYEYYYVFEHRSFSFFIRSILEFYSRMKPIERERLYFKNMIDELRKETIEKQAKMYKSEESKTITFVPFEIQELQKKEMLVITGLLIDSNGNKSVGIKQLPEFYKYRDLGYQRYSLSGDEISLIKTQFENRELTDFVVRFNNLGIEQYKNNPEGRPKTKYDYRDDVEVKIFKSKDDEMLAYFAKFGSNVTILYPDRAQNLFRDFFRYSWGNYEKIHLIAEHQKTTIK